MEYELLIYLMMLVGHVVCYTARVLQTSDYHIFQNQTIEDNIKTLNNLYTFGEM